jgi:hypothetical protein
MILRDLELESAKNKFALIIIERFLAEEMVTNNELTEAVIKEIDWRLAANNGGKPENQAGKSESKELGRDSSSTKGQTEVNLKDSRETYPRNHFNPEAQTQPNSEFSRLIGVRPEDLDLPN